jgi:hypothetical protein
MSPGKRPERYLLYISVLRGVDYASFASGRKNRGKNVRPKLFPASASPQGYPSSQSPVLISEIRQSVYIPSSLSINSAASKAPLHHAVKNPVFFAHFFLCKLNMHLFPSPTQTNQRQISLYYVFFYMSTHMINILTAEPQSLEEGYLHSHALKLNKPAANGRGIILGAER